MKWDKNIGPDALLVKHLVHVFGYRIDLHKMVKADEHQCFHSHPAHAVRLVLKGGYVEEFVDGRLVSWRTRMVGLVPPNLVHRVHMLPHGPSYSLWFRGPICAKTQLYGSGWAEDALPIEED